jgi:predicted O-methyltransferase YrrM
MHPRFEQLYAATTNRLPPRIAARADLLRPVLRASSWGPLNGQQARRQVVRDLARAITFNRVVETGTYRGTSTEFFAAVFGSPVDTVEVDPRFFTYSSQRLAHEPCIRVQMRDSRSFLRELAGTSDRRNETVFFYLDAHWNEDLPLADELRIITGGWDRAVVMIDDFEVPGDAGYGFDDYGPGRALTESYLPASELGGWSVHYPSAPSSEETGALRGTCVLSSPALADVVSDVPGLRRSRVF